MKPKARFDCNPQGDYCVLPRRLGIRKRNAIWLVTVLMLALPMTARSQCLPGGEFSITPVPQCPTGTDSITLSVDGSFGNLCWWPLTLDSSLVDDDTLWVYATELHAGYRGCFQAIVEWRFDVEWPSLQPGPHPLVMRIDVVPAFDSSEYTGTYYCNSTVTVYASSYPTGDGSLSASDVLFLVNHLFRSGAAPACGTGDVNCDHSLTSADVILLIDHIFKSGPPPPESCPP